MDFIEFDHGLLGAHDGAGWSRRGSRDVNGTRGNRARYALAPERPGPALALQGHEIPEPAAGAVGVRSGVASDGCDGSLRGKPRGVMRRPHPIDRYNDDREEGEEEVQPSLHQARSNYPRNPRLGELKRPRFGKTVLKCVESTPNHDAKVAAN